MEDLTLKVSNKDYTVEEINYHKDSHSFGFRAYKGDYRFTVDIYMNDSDYDYIKKDEYFYNPYQGEDCGWNYSPLTRQDMRDLLVLIDEVEAFVLERLGK